MRLVCSKTSIELLSNERIKSRDIKFCYLLRVCCGLLVSRRDTSILGGLSEKVPPDPIPNSVVKLLRADGTARFFVWESRSPPGSNFR